MTLVLVVLAGVVVFAIAAVVIGREARRLDAVAPRVVYQLDEATAFVAARLGEEAAGQLTPAELGDLLAWHVEKLRLEGLQPEDVTDRPQDPSLDVRLHEDDAVAHLLGRAEEDGRVLPDELVVEVVDHHFEYLRQIGAVGPPAPDA